MQVEILVVGVFIISAVFSSCKSCTLSCSEKKELHRAMPERRKAGNQLESINVEHHLIPG